MYVDESFYINVLFSKYILVKTYFEDSIIYSKFSNTNTLTLINHNNARIKRKKKFVNFEDNTNICMLSFMSIYEREFYYIL